nr:PepSY-associated TM helix domain-containing protein [uncultured Mucilaginibacter sp.]
MKVFFRNIHLYLSLAAGIVIMCSCLTGTVLVFEKEINQALHPERYFVTPAGARLPLAMLTKAALRDIPKGKLAAVMVYTAPDRSVELSITLPEKGGKGKKNEAPKEKPTVGPKGKKDGKQKEGRKPSTTVFVNPYTGQVLGQFSKKDSFLSTVEMLHRFLLAGKDSAGNLIVGISTLLFLFILITGVILWWPKTMALMRQRIKIKWDGNTKRLVHDLHLVTGFYTSIFLIVITLTGLIMTFKWANTALFTVTASKQNEKQDPPKSKYQAGLKPISIDGALRSVAAQIRTAERYNIRKPVDSLGTYSINLLQKGSFENTSDTYFIDQYSGQINGTEIFADKNLGQKARSFVKPLHTGAVYGIPTKIISFIVCLLSLIFPVTGVMMWLNRIKKKSKKLRKKRKQIQPSGLVVEV